MTKLNRRWWLLTLLAGCVTEDMDEELQVSEGEHALIAATTKAWPGGIIPVCWEVSGRDADKALVRDAVRAAWEAEANVHMTGWGTCTPQSAGVRIAIANTTPRTDGRGTDLNGRASGVVMNFDYTSGGLNPVGVCLGANRTTCLRADAVHLFGHVLGFGDETQRPDTASHCYTGGYSDANVIVGEWDANSVMNPCNPQRQFQSRLSATDIWGVQQIYGTHRPIGATVRTWGEFDISSRTLATHVAQTATVGPNSATSLTSSAGVIAGIPAIAAASATDVHAFVRGTDGQLYTKRGQNNVWPASWSSLGAQIVGSPVAIKRVTGIVDVFVRGTDARLYRKIFAEGYGFGPTELVGDGPLPPIVGEPAALAFGQHRVDVVVRGTDNRLYHTRWTGGSWTWSTWTQVSSVPVASDPVLASRDGVQLDIFARGTDDVVQYNRLLTSGTFFGWSPVGSEKIRGVPAVVAQGGNRFDLLVRGTDNALYSRVFDGLNWEPQYHHQGGPITASPVAVTSALGRIDVFARGDDSRVYTKRWFPTGWQNFQLVSSLSTMR